jgi:diguanylate cyclase (GGDEF)-like protein
MKMTESVIAFLGKLSKPLLLLSCLLFLVVISALDYLAKDFSFAVFDLTPIFLVAWFMGIWAGVFMSCASAVAYLTVDFMETPIHSNIFVHYWNAAAQLVFFIMIAYFLVELKKSLLREHELARRDPLTGALNGRAFFELARREINRSRRYKEVFTFVYLDVDDFKSINDNYGHAEGDELLRAVTETIKENLRNVDIITRMGGDEFAILMPETDHKGASVVMPRLRSLLDTAMRKKGWPATFSMGVVTYITAPDSIDTMIKKSDSVMYEAKNAGKDMIKYEVSG